MAEEPSSDEQLSDEETLKRLDEFIELRNSQLAGFERSLFNRLVSGDISLLNLGAKKGKHIRAARQHAALQLQCRIVRRNLFFLRQRRATILKMLHRCELPATVTAPPAAEALAAEDSGLSMSGDTNAQQESEAIDMSIEQNSIEQKVS